MPEPRSLTVTYTAPADRSEVSVAEPDIPARLVDGDAIRIDHEGLNQVINLEIEGLEVVDPGHWRPRCGSRSGWRRQTNTDGRTIIAVSRRLG